MQAALAPKTMTTPLPPIYRDCHRLLVHTEQMVMRFARYHKYTVGADLRQRAFGLMQQVNKAVHDKPRQGEHVQALVWQVDDYKLCLQLAMDVGAFAHGTTGQQGRGWRGKGGVGFHFFEQAATLAAGIGKQCGGWWQALARRQRANQVAPAGAAAEPVAAGHAASPARGAGSQPASPAQAHPTSLSGCATPVATGLAPRAASGVQP